VGEFSSSPSYFRNEGEVAIVWTWCGAPRRPKNGIASASRTTRWNGGRWFLLFG